jgi:hypothetical protein
MIQSAVKVAHFRVVVETSAMDTALRTPSVRMDLAGAGVGVGIGVGAVGLPPPHAGRTTVAARDAIASTTAVLFIMPCIT